MFTKLLIANRGEIACRIIKTAQTMGVRTIALYSDADKDARHVAMADESFYLGGSAPADSYLKADLIIEIAKKSGAEAIHPGYGFLSENAEFARKCEQNGIAFVGPGSDAIDAMGSKSAAKDIMSKANVPLVPGYHGDDQTDATLIAEAKAVGFPLLIKAAYGGGGKGMRIVENDGEILEAIKSARREASSSFGNDKLLMERYLRQPRHVEVQVFADTQGNAIYLSDRDCSIQRRHQKVVEEAPAPGLSDELRAQMGNAAVAAAKAIDYVGAGTVEFLLDTDNSFYFMEMNTRLQVEHPVTEMVTGQDLVKWQLVVASSGELPLRQDEVRIHGHSFEVRIYAEDPQNEFLPASGKLNFLREPEQNRHVRI
ncbi:ATP-grasp domain-containing protein, partial [Shewanella sp. SR41-2]|nr:ATP-grasp domain-containing protein [Shewanella sp. SR41-2]